MTTAQTHPDGRPEAPVDAALTAAAAAAKPVRRATPLARATWLRAAAEALEASSDTLVPLAMDESHLPAPRLEGELKRTVFQANLFAERLEQGSLFDPRIDHADPEWGMGPRPDIRRAYVGIGPVLVFAASNFPFAFSVFGGDATSALAAGCPVVVKGHPGHPELSRLTARIVIDAVAAAGAPAGTFSLIEGEQAGIDAVQDPRIKAVGFTGSTHGGRALYDLASRRPDPIPFYGELGSTNPVLVTRDGWTNRGDDIVARFVGSFTLGSGQFCTKPGIVLVPDLDGFVARLQVPAVGPMLNDRIADGFAASVTAMAEKPGTAIVSQGQADDGSPTPVVFKAEAADALEDPSLVTTEMFGPAAVLVRYESFEQVEQLLATIGGVLTATVQGGEQPDADAREALELMADNAGRVLWNQWPTGVTVSDAQQHGGPWPATTAPLSTSVGTAAAQRFARPVAYQGVPADALPAELRDRE